MSERFAKLDLVLGDICDRVEYGHLLASTDPVAFVNAVKAKLDNYAALVSRLAAALEGLDPANTKRSDCFERKCGGCSTCLARAAIADVPPDLRKPVTP